MAFLKGLFDILFYPLVHYLPSQVSLILISFLITLLITLSYKWLSNQQAIKSLKDEIKLLQEELKKNKDDKDKFAEINKRAMSKNLELMKHSMKPTIFTFIPIILLFSWLRVTYLPSGDIFSWGFKLPLFGTGIGWLWTYLLTSLISNVLLRKALKVY